MQSSPMSARVFLIPINYFNYRRQLFFLDLKKYLVTCCQYMEYIFKTKARPASVASLANKNYKVNSDETLHFHPPYQRDANTASLLHQYCRASSKRRWSEQWRGRRREQTEYRLDIAYAAVCCSVIHT